MSKSKLSNNMRQFLNILGPLPRRQKRSKLRKPRIVVMRHEKITEQSGRLFGTEQIMVIEEAMPFKKVKEKVAEKHGAGVYTVNVYDEHSKIRARGYFEIPGKPTKEERE